MPRSSDGLKFGWWSECDSNADAAPVTRPMSDQSASPATTPYDEVEYHGRAFAQTHPQRLASVAALFKLEAANPHRCRVLELGCGNGSNLIPMAFYSPNSRFVGVDLAHRPIAAGRARIERLKLTNIELIQGDVSSIGRELGSFDYLIAHGLYSWVPDEVRPHVLRVASELLSEQGIAYVSYNALPGCRLRHLVRELLQFRFGQAAHDPARITEIRQFLRDFSRVENARDPGFMSILRDEIDFVDSIPDYVLFHDDLSQHSYAFYFHEFVAQASQFGMQYLGEANLAEMFTMAGFDEFDAALDRWSASDWLAREQYQDFTKGRRFRQSLLCSKQIPIDRQVDELRIRHFDLRTALKAADTDQSAFGRETWAFTLQNRTVQVDEPIAKIALSNLGQAYPDSIGFATLLDAAISRCHLAGLHYEPQAACAAMCKLIWSLARAGLLELLRYPARLPPHDPERPRLSELVADAIRHDLPLVGAVHNTFALDTADMRRTCLMIDGLHDVAQLRAPDRLADGRNNAAAQDIDLLLTQLRQHGALT